MAGPWAVSRASETEVGLGTWPLPEGGGTVLPSKAFRSPRGWSEVIVIGCHGLLGSWVSAARLHRGHDEIVSVSDHDEGDFAPSVAVDGRILVGCQHAQFGARGRRRGPGGGHPSSF